MYHPPKFCNEIKALAKFAKAFFFVVRKKYEKHTRTETNLTGQFPSKFAEIFILWPVATDALTLRLLDGSGVQASMSDFATLD